MAKVKAKSTKRQKTPEQCAKQKYRTLHNMRKKWEKHLENNPNDKQNRKAISEKELRMVK